MLWLTPKCIQLGGKEPSNPGSSSSSIPITRASCSQPRGSSLGCLQLATTQLCPPSTKQTWECSVLPWACGVAAACAVGLVAAQKGRGGRNGGRSAARRRFHQLQPSESCTMKLLPWFLAVALPWVLNTPVPSQRRVLALAAGPAKCLFGAVWCSGGAQ